MSTAMVTANQSVTALEAELHDKVTEQVISLVSSPKAAEILAVVILNQCRKTPKLWECSRESLMDAVARIARLHLDPAIPNEVWLVPYGKEATLLYGYGGLRKLAMRSPEVRDIFAQVVCVNDVYRPADTPVALPLHRLPEGFQPRGRAIGYYAAALLTCGTYRVVSMSKAEVAAHRDRYSAAAKSQFWADNRPDLVGLTNFDKMGMKTVLRQLCSARHLSLDAEVFEALEQEARLYQPTPAELQGHGYVPPITGASSHEAEKTIEQHSEDLYGPPSATGSTQPATPPVEADERAVLRSQIDALLTAQGVTPERQSRWVARVVKKYHAETYAALTVEQLRAVYTDLLHAVRMKAEEGVCTEPNPVPGQPATEEAASPLPTGEADQEPLVDETPWLEEPDHDASCTHDEPELPMAIPPQGWREELRHLASNTLEVVTGSKDKAFEASAIKTCEVILRLCDNPTFTEEEAQEQTATLKAIGKKVADELGF